MNAKDMNAKANENYLKLLNSLVKREYKRTMKSIKYETKRGSMSARMSYFVNSYYPTNLQDMVVEMLKERLESEGYCVKIDLDCIYPQLYIKWCQF